MNLRKPKKLYRVRCRPDCPYDWCEIVTDKKPKDYHKQRQSAFNKQQDISNGAQNNNLHHSPQEKQKARQKFSKAEQKQLKSAPSKERTQKAPEGGQPRDMTKPPKVIPIKVSPQQMQQIKVAVQQSQQRKTWKKPKKGYKPQYEQQPAISIMMPGSGAGDDESQLFDLGNHKEREHVITDQTFQLKLKNVMVDNAFDRRVRGRKRGRLDMRALHKVPMKVESVFTLKEARKNKHYNVMLLVDQSGSMMGEPIKIAADVATFLGRSFGGINVNYGVIGFDTGWRYHKKLDESVNDDKLKKLHYDMTHSGGGGTNYLDPLKVAYRDLQKHPEYTNIVINISDGQPSDGDLCKRYIAGNTRIADYVEVAIQSKPLVLTGIEIKDVDELKPLLLGELRKRIKRG